MVNDVNKLTELQNESMWNEKWDSIFDQYQADLRHGWYVAAFLNSGIETVLEIGAGSFRDIAFIARLGKKIGAFDFSLKACNLAQQKHPNLAKFFWCDDAFATKLQNKSFDASFSNGFIGCFDDEQIHSLIKEQLRVTKKQMIITLHNGHNQGFKNYFIEKKNADNLYEVRFFTLDEINIILDKFSFCYKIFPVGKAYKELEDTFIKNNASLAEIKECILSQKMQYLESSERLMVVIDI